MQLQREYGLVQRAVEKLAGRKIGGKSGDFHRLRPGHISAGDEGLQTNARMLVSHERAQQRERIRKSIGTRANNADGVSGRSQFVSAEKAGKQFGRDSFVALIDAKRFDERSFSQGGARSPFFQRGDDLFRRSIRQHALGELARPAVSRFPVLTAFEIGGASPITADTPSSYGMFANGIA